MPRQVLIVHGWSDDSDSFIPLAEFLEDHEFQAEALWLGDYISLEDDVKVEDVAKRMQAVILDMQGAGRLGESFDMIVHSTGGLVARQWLATYHTGGMDKDGKACPVRRLIMLAPANFGSRLATMGQSMLGRIVKGWKNWFHTGKEMLAALSLASDFQWELAQRDLFMPEGETDAPAVYGGEGVLPFVIVGTHPYTSLLRQIVNENGADGTVRVPAANLNVRGITIDFSKNEENPAVDHWRLRHKELEFPLAVLANRTHGSIVNPKEVDIACNESTHAQLGELILRALRCESTDDYKAITDEWKVISETTARLAQLTDEGAAARRAIFDVDDEDKVEYFHQYMQVVVRVYDDHGDLVPDFFLEFFGAKQKSDKEAIYFHSSVLEQVFVNGATRCLYVDRTDLVNGFYNQFTSNKTRELCMSVSASPPGDHVSYFSNFKAGAAGQMVVHTEKEDLVAVAPAPSAGTAADKENKVRWLKRNCTHFVKIIIPRSPHNEVFTVHRSDQPRK